jgi:hypothetical protein
MILARIDGSLKQLLSFTVVMQSSTQRGTSPRTQNGMNKVDGGGAAIGELSRENGENQPPEGHRDPTDKEAKLKFSGEEANEVETTACPGCDGPDPKRCHGSVAPHVETKKALQWHG